MVRRGWLGVCVVFARAWSLRPPATSTITKEVCT